jgi:hypothetical protein
MTTARQYATATRLGDGTVLVAGGVTTGCGDCATDSAEIYDPATRSFHPTGHLHFPRSGQRASLLPDGRVLITGGLDNASDTVLDSAEIYSPASASFTLAPPMSSGRYLHTATTLRSGQVLIAGGFDSLFEVTDTAELYNPSNGIFTPTGRMTSTRAGHGAAALEVSAPTLLQR